MTLLKLKENRKVNGYSNLNELLDTIFNENLKPNGVQLPPVNVVETEAYFELALAAPGLKKEDFKIALEKDILTISSENKTEETNVKYTRKEFGFSSFSRAFTLPESVDYTNIEASYHQGVLVVKIGKKEEAKILSREIEIK
ncbi:Hsp20/alpha crystallin family protein [Pedobacter alpinus]|uniref:Hsp20/alpha crystallin family protein n=1 Tax=Pedobacter alpinus TaxID=1590643 RepID=A0ABW5TU58_9SPHI